MELKTRGIVLQSIKYSETSVIARIFTEKAGLVSYLVNGVRSQRTLSKAVMMRPLSLLELDVTQRDNKSLQRIREFRRAFTFQTIPYDTVKSGLALFLVEVVSKTLKEHDVHEELFELVYDQLVALDEAATVAPFFHLQFLLQYAHLLGFGPHDNFEPETPCFDLQEGVFVAAGSMSNRVLNQSLSAYLHQLMQTTVAQQSIPKSARRELLNALLRYYQLHIDGFGALKSHEVLEAVFS
ncbi:MAG: DNA repair protein RecO [Chitinophagales bacterium]